MLARKRRRRREAARAVAATPTLLRIIRVIVMMLMSRRMMSMYIPMMRVTNMAMVKTLYGRLWWRCHGVAHGMRIITTMVMAPTMVGSDNTADDHRAAYADEGNEVGTRVICVMVTAIHINATMRMQTRKLTSMIVRLATTDKYAPKDETDAADDKKVCTTI